METSKRKGFFFIEKTVELGMPKKGLKQVADVQHSALLHP